MSVTSQPDIFYHPDSEPQITLTTIRKTESTHPEFPGTVYLKTVKTCNRTKENYYQVIKQEEELYLDEHGDN